jgi:hypothetical protein
MLTRGSRGLRRGLLGAHSGKASCSFGSGRLVKSLSRPLLRLRSGKGCHLLGASRCRSLSRLSSIESGSWSCFGLWTWLCSCSVCPRGRSRSSEAIRVVVGRLGRRGTLAGCQFCSSSVILALLKRIAQDLMGLLNGLEFVDELDFVPSIAIGMV